MAYIAVVLAIGTTARPWYNYGIIITSTKNTILLLNMCIMCEIYIIVIHIAGYNHSKIS